MSIIEALKKCQEGELVRPVCWRTLNPRAWIECRWQGAGQGCCFVESGVFREMPVRLQLQFDTELLGPWEVVT